VSTDREIADYLDIALILFIVVAAIPLLVLLEPRSGALLEQISSWRPTCFLVPCEAQAKLRPSLNFLNLSFNFHGIRRELTSMVVPDDCPPLGYWGYPSRRTHQPPRRSSIECWRDRSMHGPWFD
jgi:hypothetical protein